MGASGAHGQRPESPPESLRPGPSGEPEDGTTLFTTQVEASGWVKPLSLGNGPRDHLTPARLILFGAAPGRGQ